MGQTQSVTPVVPVVKKEEVKIDVYKDELKRLAPRFVDMIGENELAKESNTYYSANIARILWCAEHYIPPEQMDFRKDEHVAKRNLCGGWRLKSEETENSMSFGTVSGRLSYYVKNLKTRDTNHFSKETEQLEYNTPFDKNVIMNVYLMERYRILKDEAERKALFNQIKAETK